jgi:LmbE family N-acetylglucosaminyl deacetylase
MQFTQSQADFFVPDGSEESAAIARTTHLGIGAHQDDLEFMCLQGILPCLDQENAWFGGIVCTDGSGSSRRGPFAHYTNEAMQAVRFEEQRAAARIGQYSFIAQLAQSSASLKSAEGRRPLVQELTTLLRASRPRVVYAHHPFDKHPSHVAVFLATLDALRALSAEERPAEFIGCEGWRGLDWLPDERKLIFDVSARPEFTETLNAVFASQIAGGKRYDLAVLGRRRANATFFDSHTGDDAESVAYGIDLRPLIADANLTVDAFINEHLSAFAGEVTELLARVR